MHRAAVSESTIEKPRGPATRCNVLLRENDIGRNEPSRKPSQPPSSLRPGHRWKLYLVPA